MPRQVLDFQPAKLTAALHRAGLSPREAAHAAGLSPHTVWSWQRGASRPTVVSLTAVARVLRVQPSALRADEGWPLPLRSIRLERGMRMAAVAAVMGVSPATLSRAERGVGGLSAALASRLAAAYGTPEADICAAHAASQRRMPGPLNL